MATGSQGAGQGAGSHRAGSADRATSRGEAAIAAPDQIGQRLRHVRQSLDISLREMARRIGVSPSFVSQVELGRTSPSVGTLYAFVTQLGLSLDGLMSDGSGDVAKTQVETQVDPPASPGHAGSGTVRWPQISVPVQPATGRRKLKLSGVTWERLTHDDDPFVDFLYVTYQPGGASCQDGDLMRHGGREYGYVLSGYIDVQVGGEHHRLAPGDSIHFDSLTPHRLSNPHREPCVAIWVVVGRHTDGRPAGPGPAGNQHPGSR